MGYTYNNMCIFQNFDVGRRKTKYNISGQVHFNTAPSFSSIIVVVWEDSKLYYLDQNYNDFFIYEVKALYDKEETIQDLRGCTPELKTLYLFHDIQRQGTRLRIETLQKEQDKLNYLTTLPGRLQQSFANVGATIMDYSVEGQGIMVVWKLNNSTQRYNSIIDSTTLSVVEAGYCMEGDDKNHSIPSMVLTAEDWEEQDLIYITRR